MTKHAQKQQISADSPLERLRRYLEDAERQIVVMRETPEGPIAVIRAIDTIDQLLNELAHPETDTRAEEARVEALRLRLVRNAPAIARRIRARGQVEQLAESPMWQAIEDAAQARRRRLLRRLLGIGGGIALVALFLFVGVPWLFPVTPQPNLDAIQLRVDAGDVAGALSQAEAELKRYPNNVDILLWVGALRQHSGDQAGANAAWEQARRQLGGDEKTFYFQRGNMFLQLKDFAKAEADANTLINQSGHALEGYYLLGSVREIQDRIPDAIAAFDRASTLAEQTGNDQFVGVIRVRLAYLWERNTMSVFPTPSAESGG